MINVTYFDSPVGRLRIVSKNNSLTMIVLDHHEPAFDCPFTTENTPLHNEAAKQLGEYFDGTRTQFDLPLAPEGTPFQQKDWEALRSIPYGTTCSYKDIAEAIGCPKGFRAVGMANNKNPIMIVIPCHRVIGADGSLTGYDGGIHIKKFLLEHEGVKL